MVIKRERLRVPVTPAAEMHIWDDLHQDFPGLINDVKSSYWSSLRLGFVDSGEGIPGEIYFPQNGAILYYKVDPRREFIEAGCLLPNGDGVQTFQGFCERIKEAVMPGKREAHPHWRPYTDTNATFELVREEAQNVTATAEQLNAASALADAERRDLLRSIQSQRSCLLEKLTTPEKSLMQVGQDVGLLESLGLVQKDFVVFCREQGNQISRVSNFSQIEDATRRGFKCFSCGRPIAEERIDQLLAPTAEGQQLARPNYWLSLLLSQALENMRIPMEQQVTIAAGEQARVLDLFANHDGILMMFEVKEEKIQLDDVFLFFSRVRYYRPNVAFLVTTRPVGAEVRQYLQAGEAEGQVMLLEGIADLERHVGAVLAREQRGRFRHIVEMLEPGTRVDVGSLVFEFFFGKEEKVREAMSEAGEKLVEGALFAAQPEVEPPRPAEEHLPVEENPSQETPLVEPQPPMPVVEEQPTPVVDSRPSPREEPSEPAGMGMDEGDLGPLTDMSAGMMGEELLLDQPILEIQEIVDMGEMTMAPDRPSGDEEREAIIRRLTDEIVVHGVPGRFESLNALLGELNAIPTVSSALVTDDGLVIAEALGARFPDELVAALCAEMHDQTQRGMEEMGVGRANRVLVESMGDRLDIRPVGDRVLLVVREERPMRDSEEESANTLPGEMVLREAMLKKVLEDLTMVEGVKGGIVAGRDGLAIDYAIAEETMPPDYVSAILSLIVVESEKMCKRLDLHPIRQISVRTAETQFSLIPLDKEGILITMLEPGRPREVWQNRLYAAANMLTSVFQ
jgi:predicted regulator of Ras-like GTPase activity (Roadblock/LC7/MglB family)